MESFRAGQTLNEGRYRIIQEVNRGATATIFKALDTTDETKVALKVMNSMDSPQTAQLKMVKREVDYARHTSHSNIVRLLNVFAESKQLILVWEWIEGRDLLDLLNRVGGRMPEDMASFYLHQILRGVAFMHEQTFCHRDLKPENCMVETKTQILKIIDFGLSKHLDSAETFGVGTPDYMSPEMLGIIEEAIGEEGPKYDAKAVDVWALGVTFYLLVTGVYPFENPEHPHSLSHTLQNIRKGAIQPLPDNISSDCETLIRQLLVPSPKERPTLKETAENKWLNKNARFYAFKIEKPELYVSPNPQRVRFRDSVVDIDSSLQELNGVEDSRVSEETTGCFGAAPPTNKRGFFSFFRNLFQ